MTQPDHCYRCDVPMVDGVAMREEYIAGAPEFPGSTSNTGQTMIPSGQSRMVNVRKCPACGHSYEV